MRGFFTGVQRFAEKLGVVESQDVAEMRGHWLSIHKFFGEVQKAQKEEQMERFRLLLPDVERQLDRIAELLLRERNTFVVSVEQGAPQFPPCYEFLLRGSGAAVTGPAAVGQGSGGGGGGLSSFFGGGHDKVGVGQGGGHAGAGAGNAALGSGRDLITCVCQYAKHDQPRGARAIMLRFLTKLFGQVDTNTGSKSLFHFSNDYIAMPVADMLLRVGISLNPPNSSGAVSGKGASSHRVSGHSQDHYELVMFCSVLCQQIERIPSIATFFLMDRPAKHPAYVGKVPMHLGAAAHAAHHSLQAMSPVPKILTAGASHAAVHDDGAAATPPAATAAARGDDHTPAQTLMMLHTLLYYINVNAFDTQLPEERRIAAVREAFRGIACLAKCRDPAIVEMISGGSEIRDIVLGELTSAVYTLCTVPSNPFFCFQFDYVQEAFSFMDELMALVPHVGASLQLESKIAQALVHEMLATLLCSKKDQTFLSAALVVSSVLKRIQGEEIRCTFGKALLSDERVVDAVLAHVGSPSDDACHAALLLINALIERTPSLAMRFLLDFDLAASVEEVAKCVTVASRDAAGVEASELPDGTKVFSAASFPLRGVGDVFPAALRVDYICGSTSATFNVEAQQALLRAEAMLFADDYRTLSRKRYLIHRRHSEHSPFIACRFYSPRVAGSKLVQVLAANLRVGLLERPFSVAAAMSQVVVNICALPDTTVAYTLLHDAADCAAGHPAGPLHTVMLAIKAYIDKIAVDEAQALAGPGAAGSASPGGASAVAAASLANDLVGATTRLAIYHHCARRPFFEEDEQDVAGETPFALALRDHRAFANACVAIEGLRHELTTLFAMKEMNEQWEKMTGEAPKRRQ